MAIPEIITNNASDILHIIFGLIIMYVGYSDLNHYAISQFTALLLIITGTISVLYASYMIYNRVVE